jgi:hypothetical protein
LDSNGEADTTQAQYGARELLAWCPGDQLLPLEEKLCSTAAAGELLDCGGGQFSLSEMQAWGQDRTVRAQVLRFLLISDEWPADPRGPRMRGVRISGVLDMKTAALRCPLLLESCYLDASEPVCLEYATVPLVVLKACHLTGINGDGLKVRGLNLDRSSCAEAIWLKDAEIAGQLTCRGANLGCDDIGRSLSADQSKVGGSVFLDKGFSTKGVVRFDGAQIGGQLSCSGATLGANGAGEALVANNVKVAGAVHLNQGFVAAGTVLLASADIAGQLSCRNAEFGSRSLGLALRGDTMAVRGDVLLDGRFRAAGRVSLVSARVGGSMVLALGRPDDIRRAERRRERERFLGLIDDEALDWDPAALDATGARITDKLTWKPDQAVYGTVDLSGATVGELDDDWSGDRINGHWPDAGRLHLAGLTYTRLAGNHQGTVAQRLDWLRGQYRLASSGASAGFASQPYEQLATAYRQAGQIREARQVAIARRRDLRTYGTLTRFGRLANWFLDKTIGYGYKTQRAAIGLAAAFAGMWILAAAAQHLHVIIPVGDIAGLRSSPSATDCTGSYPCFYPAGYAADTVLPIINVHQAEFWGISGHSRFGWAWVAASWLMTGLGWAMATLLVAGYTGLVRRD